MRELTVEAKVERLPEVTAFIDEQLEALDCAMKAQMQIELALDELFTNISSYAYPDGTGDATIRFEFDEATRIATIVLIDSGVPYDPLKKDDPDVTLPVEARGIGGLGIFLAKKNMDEMHYERADGQNILRISKAI